VKEAVGASLLGCKAPFRLVQDHSRSGRLEASTLALRKWLFSEDFDRYLSLAQVRTSFSWGLLHLGLIALLRVIKQHASLPSLTPYGLLGIGLLGYWGDIALPAQFLQPACLPLCEGSAVVHFLPQVTYKYCVSSDITIRASFKTVVSPSLLHWCSGIDAV